MGVAAFAVGSVIASVLCFWAPLDNSTDAVYPEADRAAVRPRVAIIIDDLGYDARLARKFFSLGLPLTMAVIPYAPHAAVIQSEAAARGFETIAHIPMEPKNFPETDPGPGALLMNMDAEGITKALEGNLALVPGVVGVSNHMGSAFTESRDKMEAVIGVLRKRGLFFLDSLTSPATVGRDISRSMGVKFAARDIFLDNEINHEHIERQLELLLVVAERNGRAVGIGHPYPETIEVLAGYRERLLSGFDLVPVSRIVSVPAYGGGGS